MEEGNFQQELGKLVLGSLVLYQRAENMRVRSDKPGLEAMVLIESISRFEEGVVTFSMLSRLLKIPTSSLSNQLDQLEIENLIVRSGSDSDKRSKIITLTTEGKRILTKFESVLGERLSYLLLGDFGRSNEHLTPILNLALGNLNTAWGQLVSPDDPV